MKLRPIPCFSCLAAVLFSCNPGTKAVDPVATSWKVYRGTYESNAYSSLDQINVDNVDKLKVAWTYRTGDHQPSSSIQCNPLIVGDTMYISTPGSKIIALNAAKGSEIWKYDPETDISNPVPNPEGVHRGLTYWEDGSDKRLFYCVLNEIRSIDAKTGTLVTSFGNNGVVDLRDHLDRKVDKETAHIRNTSPGVVYKDLLIMGSSVNEAHGSLPGHIRAYDIRSGELKWVFHTIPHPGEFGYETWPEDYYLTGGGVNAWGGLSLDMERGILYAPLGSPTHDFYGIDRKGKGLFGNSLLALDAATGQYKWHFQVSRHDLWDFDLPAPPNLIQVEQQGKMLDAIAQVTKQGFVFVLDRETGEPLFDVEERTVPQSNMEGESTWPTQPFPLKPPPLARLHFADSLITNISPESEAYVREKIKHYTYGGIYTPPSEEGIVQLPGFRGGAEWSGGAFDPETGIIYVGINDIPNLVQLTENSPNQEVLGEFDNFSHLGKTLYDQNCAACHGSDQKGNEVFPSLLGMEDKLSLEQASALLKNGRGMMPSFSMIPEKSRRAILAYLYQLDYQTVQEKLPLTEKLAPKKPIGTDTLKRYKLKAYQQLRDHNGYPGIKPPWGKLCAVNLNSGELVWEIPLGEYEELSEQGIPITGTQLFGGGIVTAGGLVFIGATRDEKFRAIDKSNGKVLWEYQLPAGGYATPSTYSIEGKQYVVIAAGGGGMQGTKSGDHYLAFELK